MDDNLTVLTNDKTISFVRKEIARKRGDMPYLASGKAITNILTDMDHHPYNRWYRGVYYYPEPVVMEREAGWREQRPMCYDLVVPREPEEQPNHCYESACSTTFPCFPNLTTRFSDREVLRHTVNKECIVQYR